MAPRKGGGFWRGILTGLVMALAITAGLVWTFPPLRAPLVDKESLIAPTPPDSPPVTIPPRPPVPEDALPAHSAPASAPPPEPDRQP